MKTGSWVPMMYDVDRFYHHVPCHVLGYAVCMYVCLYSVYNLLAYPQLWVLQYLLHVFIYA